MQGPAATMRRAMLPLLMACTLLSPAVAGDMHSRSFEALSHAEQERLVRHWLVDRFDASAPLALDDTERQRLGRRYAEVMRRIAAGETLSAAGFQRLVDELGAVEQAAIDQLSLRYRVQVYGRFRTDRVEYDRRMAQWRGLLADWKASKRKVATGELVVDWLKRSLHRLQYDELARLPELPDFEERIAAPVKPALPPSVPSGPATPHIATQRSATVPPVSAPFDGTVPSPVPRQPISPTDPARIDHRVAKPPIPETAAPPRTVARHVPPVIAPPEATPQTVAAPEEPPVMVDLEELAIRIRGYNLALKELTAHLQGDSINTPDQLRQAFAQFEDLAARRDQIVLYRNLVTNDERQRAGEPMSLDSAIALLGGKIFAARTSLTSQGPEHASSEYLHELDRLSRKLAQLAAQREP